MLLLIALKTMKIFNILIFILMALITVDCLVIRGPRGLLFNKKSQSKSSATEQKKMSKKKMIIGGALLAAGAAMLYKGAEKKGMFEPKSNRKRIDQEPIDD
ncbi:hypothetical protein GJ496_002085 [Pomphorhynchus laevis]|nr:hypothetical protein GJ496_002085 [Pomphorhynchus laevis]